MHNDIRVPSGWIQLPYPLVGAAVGRYCTARGSPGRGEGRGRGCGEEGGCHRVRGLYSGSFFRRSVSCSLSSRATTRV